ncbi:MAG: carbonic anhydrase [Burkholderiaceae bacterium]|nr:carbonic anhydrase [Burkholderiaceae bacterium]
MKDIGKFITGFERFQAKYFGEEQGLFSQLRQNQKPRTLVIACCDSRVDPAMMTGADPGELFVIRNVANLVPPYRHEAQAPGIRAAIEFATKSLEVEHIIVLGHSSCGGIHALMDCEGSTHTHYEFVGSWVSIAQRAREQVLRELPHKSPAVQARACEQAAILVSLDNLLSFPWIQERVNQGSLFLHGWYFDIDAGELLAYNAQTSMFSALNSDGLVE